MDKDTSMFGKAKDTSLSDVLEDIYKNSKSKDKQIIDLIEDLKGLIKTINDAIVIVPLISQYLEVAVKNDKHLVDLSVIMQRLIVAQQKIDSSVKSNEDESQLVISEADKRQLFQILDSSTKELKQLDSKKNKNEFVESIKKDIDEKAKQMEQQEYEDDEEEDM